MKDADTSIQRPRHGFLLVRGESIIASAGLALASLLLLVMAASAYFNVDFQRQAMEAARGNQVEALSAVLVDAVASLVEADELTSARRLITETARAHELDLCRLSLSDGRVVADGDPSRITLQTLPATWSSAAVVPEASTSDGVITLTYPISVPGRGTAMMQVRGRVRLEAATFWESNAGIGLTGAIALLGLLVIYRRVRSRVGALSVIREALMTIEAGEQSLAVLSVPDRMGPEAAAWNHLLESRARLEQQLLGQRAELALDARREGGADLDNACDILKQGLILLDRENGISYLNGSAAVYLRTTREEALGQPLSRFVDDESVLTSLESAVSRLLRCWTGVEVVSEDHGTRVVLRFSLRPLRREDANSAVIVIDDVTQQRVAEESRNAFVAQVTHELRTPLTNIRLYAEHAIEEGEPSPETQRSLNVINQESKRLERIVADMLSVAEIEAGKYEIRADDVRLEDLFGNLQHDYREYAAEKNMALVFDLPPKMPVLHGDRDKVSMALHNLLGNAIKYTPEGGRVEVRVTTDGGTLVVEVVDNGIGINEVEQERIFEKFYRADDGRVADITGSGLGLALAREVIRMHGGDITVQSQIDKGSTFVLTIPVMTRAAAA